MAAGTSTLAHRIAQSIIAEENFGMRAVWTVFDVQKEDGSWEDPKRTWPKPQDYVVRAVMDRVEKIHPSNLGILIDTARYNRLPVGQFMGDVKLLGVTGRHTLRDAAAAAIISEMLEIL